MSQLNDALIPTGVLVTLLTKPQERPLFSLTTCAPLERPYFYRTYRMLSRAANRNSRMYQQISGRTTSLPGWKAVLGVSSASLFVVVANYTAVMRLRVHKHIHIVW